jgi:hypothetical protein
MISQSGPAKAKQRRISLSDRLQSAFERRADEPNISIAITELVVRGGWRGCLPKI